MIEQEIQWQAVIGRDPNADGQFVYAVRTTGVYCRPSCASRPPKRENVCFFRLPAAAESAGFRPCKRCRPHTIPMIDERVCLTQAICDYLRDHADDSAQITLEALGAHFHFTPHYLQTTFKAILGITPKQFVEAHRLKAFKADLRTGRSIGEAIYQAGYGSPSRIYERVDDHLGMTPATYQRGGAMIQITYTTIDCYLGILLVAMTPRGICAVSLHESVEAAESSLHAEYPHAQIQPDAAALADAVSAILDHVEGKRPHLALPLDIQATAFQWRVWQALREIPRGETRSYADIAQAIGDPDATRAVASACAANVVAIVIPCHRVVRKDGGLSGYRWGVERKRRLLEAEQAIPAVEKKLL
ncbi:MAG: bifunctional DNA-binding transcriptional regulator/O6-methylguanine-DNA methyltransferase Ada [Anaerolineae bacterium]|jgi:AraC family transcriptional regulator of adaptative response/methylated-DNA-[protein]-cysteine methyltransferase|nr:bifunctional DNA-binding transcriptional regulator/O6-methylguanine-DNA methyltransferase Ada [Anaerolineae bacterium]